MKRKSFVGSDMARHRYSITYDPVTGRPTKDQRSTTNDQRRTTNIKIPFFFHLIWELMVYEVRYYLVICVHGSPVVRGWVRVPLGQHTTDKYKEEWSVAIASAP